MDIKDLLKVSFVSALTNKLCGDNTELIERPASFIVRNKEEGERDIHRVIIIPPKGYTADKPNQTNSHDEAEYATIKINGAVREGRQAFSKIKNCLLVASFNEKGKVSELNKPYLTFDLTEDNPDLVTKIHSAGEPPFSVVKSNGYGFYHNLMNVSDDWLVLSLYKRLRPQKHVDLGQHLASIQNEYAETLSKLYDAVVIHGDGIFNKEPDLIKKIIDIPPNITLPSLGEMLYVHDTGKHEACSVFAIILKIGRDNPELVTSFLQDSMDNGTILPYYAQQLIEKINNQRATSPALPQQRL